MNNINHLSYSTCKKIYRKGIDYAVASKLGVIDDTSSRAADIGTMAHAMLLGGDPDWVVNDQFPDFRTKAAREWRDEQAANGKIIISEVDFAQISAISDAVKNENAE